MALDAMRVAFSCAALLATGCTMKDPSDPWVEARIAMVRDQIEARGIREPRLLEALRRVERHRFAPPSVAPRVYEDRALGIGYDQTISQPYIVAFMTDALRLEGHERVLEVGTGSGYQAAVLAALCEEVFSIEIVEPLARRAAAALREVGVTNVHFRIGDGYAGWPDRAPFDAIIVTAAPDHVPPRLLEQLRVGGRLVIPVGGAEQDLRRVTRTVDGFETETLIPVRFVPMTGEAQRR